MTQYWVYDRNGKNFQGPYPSNADAVVALRKKAYKTEGKHGGTPALEVVTSSDPVYGGNRNDK